MNEPVITTIIPTFERPSMLTRAVLSVLDQGFDSTDVWIYDNASQDETESVAKALCLSDSRVKYYRQPENVGSTANFNFAMTRIQTRYFSFLSDDDFLLPGFYAAAVASLESQPNADFWCGRTAILDEPNRAARLTPAWPSGYYRAGEESMLRMIRHHYPWNGVLWRHDVLNSVNKLDAYGSDDNFIVKAALFNNFVVSDQLAAALTLHRGGWTGGMLGELGSVDSSVSRYLDHAIGRPRELQRDLKVDPRVPSKIQARAIRALDRELEHDVLAYLLSVAIPLGRDREVSVIRALLAEVQGSAFWRVIAACTQVISRRRVLRESLRRGLGLIVSMRQRARINKQRDSFATQSVLKQIELAQIRTSEFRRLRQPT